MQWLSIFSVAAIAACAPSNLPSEEQTSSLSFETPEHFPGLDLEHWPTESQITLGRWLFYDQRLSVDGTRSCGVCHEQEKAFSDGLIRGLGAQNTPLPTNSLSLFNVAWRTELTWNRRIEEIEEHMLIPLFSENPIEMGMTEELILSRIKDEDHYVEMFAAAFPHMDSPVNIPNVIKAIADFTRTLTSARSPYDLWLIEGESLSPDVLRGKNLFFSDRAKCGHCHGGIFFDQPTETILSEASRHGYFNTGLYNIDGEGGYPPEAMGLFEATGLPEDMGRFRIPSLRNLSYTYPWSHDGTQLSLEAIIDAYARGGRKIEGGPYRGDGQTNPFKSPLISGFELNESEKNDLIAFLLSLNDPDVLHNEDFQTPFCQLREGAVVNEPCEEQFKLE